MTQGLLLILRGLSKSRMETNIAALRKRIILHQLFMTNLGIFDIYHLLHSVSRRWSNSSQRFSRCFFGSAGKDETSSDEGTKKFAKTDQTVLEVLATRQMTY